MPPKKGGAKQKKAQERAQGKAKEKVIADKTFGMKNKNKSKAVQKKINQMQQGQPNAKQAAREAQLARERKAEKERAAQAKKEMAMLFTPAVKQPKVPFGVDPKTILCEYFRAGSCQKGAKCKFSHDRQVERKVAKRNLYVDDRGGEGEEDEAARKKADTMDNWTQEQLEKAVDEKRTKANRNLKTSIVCKHFLAAVEEQKYGWFWECPNGGKKCQYVHALPPGFVLKRDKAAADAEANAGPSLEEVIEAERRAIGKGTPVTWETFSVWRMRKDAEAKKKADEEKAKRVAGAKSGKTVLSGREAFEFNPDMFVDDESAADDMPSKGGGGGGGGGGDDDDDADAEHDAQMRLASMKSDQFAQKFAQLDAEKLTEAERAVEAALARKKNTAAGGGDGAKKADDSTAATTASSAAATATANSESATTTAAAATAGAAAAAAAAPAAKTATGDTATAAAAAAPAAAAAATAAAAPADADADAAAKIGNAALFAGGGDDLDEDLDFSDDDDDDEA